jgi:hypothetical protein
MEGFLRETSADGGFVYLFRPTLSCKELFTDLANDFPVSVER